DLHLTWFIRQDWFTDRSNLEVYYAYRPGTLGDETVLGFVPTATPPPTMVALPVFEATSTPIPTVAPMDANVRVDTSQDMYATETLIGVALVSIVLCCGVFVFQRFVWRR
ncbi:MAG: hypothetical protein K8J31_31395, partial [Anaerolineae bacterium]|nr:hypothetical protein [Anaerolineae bacterium]